MIESPLLENLTGYIGGRWTDNEHGNTYDVYNPAKGEVVARVIVDPGNETVC
jgi:succinate-semialdehyde dehydrogenase/glutarate-semialdehyde dehydrogenase